MAEARIREPQSTTAAAASATNVEEVDRGGAAPEEDEGGDMTDDENDLHGPCNVRPSDADENPRSVRKYFFFMCCIYQ